MELPPFLASAWQALIRAEHHAERLIGLHPPADLTPDLPSPAAAVISTGVTGEDPIVGPAFPWLSKWTPADRQALLDAQIAVGLDPKIGGLLAVIDHESGGNPAALNPLPAAGLIQLTRGANLPGFTDADAIRAVATWSPARQLAEVVTPFYRRMFPSGASAQDGVALLRRNFLPAVASESASYVLGVKPGSTGPNGETSDDRIGTLTRGAIYSSNAGFDSGGRGYFTWADADRQAAASVARGAKGGLMRVSGAIVSPDPVMAGAAGYDPVTWIEIDVNGYKVKTNAEPLSIGGVPVAMSFAQLLDAARSLNAIPITAPISDARWAAAEDRRIVNPVPSKDGAHYNDTAQNATFAAAYGPLGTILRDGGHKEMVLAPNLVTTGPNSMIFYGWRKADGSTYQKGIRSDHDRAWIEYDSYGSLARRDATDPQGNSVDLLDVLSAGGSPLMAGKLPAFLDVELRGGSASGAGISASHPLAGLGLT